MKHLLLLLTLFLLSFGLYAQQQQIDSLKQLVSAGPDDTLKLFRLNQLAKYYNNSRQVQNATSTCRQIITLAEQLCSTLPIRRNEIAEKLEFTQQIRHDKKVWKRYKTIEAWAYSVIADSCLAEGNSTAALFYQDQAMGLEKEAGYASGIIVGYYNIAGIYLKNHQYAEVTENYMAALKVSEDVKDTGNIAYFASAISSLYSMVGKYKQALKYDTLAFNLSIRNGAIAREQAIYRRGNQVHPPSVISHTYSGGFAGSVGTDYCNLNKFKEAIPYYQYSRQAALESNDTGAMMSALEELSKCYSHLGDTVKSFDCASLHLKLEQAYGDTAGIASGYRGMGDYDVDTKNFNEALKNYASCLALYTAIEDSAGIAAAMVKLGEYYLAKEDYRHAVEHLKKGAELGKQYGAKYNSFYEISLSQTYSEAYTAAQKAGDYKTAFTYSLLYAGEKDSTIANEERFNVDEMMNKYVTDKKDADIKLLNKDKEIETAEIGKQKLLRNGFIAGFGVVALFLGVVFVQRNRIAKEKDRSEGLLLNILPAEVAEELKAKGEAEAKLFDDVTVLFTDFKSFTIVSERLTPQQLVNELHSCFKAFDGIMEKYKIEKIKTVGDAYMAVSGLPLANPTHAETMVKAALEIRDFMLNRRKELGEGTFEVRIGINSGKVVAGIVGVKKFAYDIWGDTVNTAARMEQNGQPGKVNISQTTYELVKDKFTCEHRGKIEAKNKGQIDMYFVRQTG